MRVATLIAALVVSVALSAPAQEAVDNVAEVIGSPAGSPRTGSELDAETERTASVLRCPVCQGLSINDSPAEMAVNMKARTRSMLARGYSSEQVIEYFERSYGEFVRLEPKREGLNWVVWLAPLVALGAGAIFVRSALRKSVRRRETVEPALAPIPDDLLPWVERVRAMASESEPRA